MSPDAPALTDILLADSGRAGSDAETEEAPTEKAPAIVTWVNDEEKKSSPLQEDLSPKGQGVVNGIRTKVPELDSFNVNSGRRNTGEPYASGRGIDINRINGMRVDGLKNEPPRIHPVHRIVDAIAELDSSFRPGNAQRLPAFTSTSVSRSVAEHYAGEGPRLVYSIESKRGRYLREYSAAATTPRSITEKEVLFDRRTRFTIESTKRDGLTLHVSLKEK